MINKTISPTFIPHNVAEVQQLQLLHQIQNGTLPQFDILILNQLLHLPFLSIETKLAIYNFLSSLPFVSSIHLSQGWFSIVLLMFPLLMLGFLIVSAFIVFSLLRNSPPILSFIFSRFIKKVEEKTFLELTFPSDTSKSAYATEQLYTLIHTLAKRKNFYENLTNQKRQYSLEILSTKNEGIRYLLIIPLKDADILKRSLLSYLPGIKIKESGDYLSEEVINNPNLNFSIAELKLSSHFALPLNKQKVLSEHDPISYLTGQMTELPKDELIAFQVITTPVLNSIHRDIVKRMNDLRKLMYQRQPLAPVLNYSLLQQIASLPLVSIVILPIKIFLVAFKFMVMFIYSMFLGLIDPNSKTIPFLMTAQAIKNASIQETLNPYEQELQTIVKEKIDQQLFESTIRILIAGKDAQDLETRMGGLLSAFGLMSSAYQSLVTKRYFFISPFKRRLSGFKKRTLSTNTGFNPNPILSSSEISDIYHFPFTETTKTEDLVKVHSKDLPAPISLKNGKKLDVIFGKNNYGNSETDIGLTDDDRSRHVYLLGQTGSGKSTIIFHMAKGDIQKGRGLAVIDPHGDLAEDLLSTVSDDRKDDLIYFNPFDLKYPIGINLLELTPELDEDVMELEKELVCESVITIFRRVFSKDENVDAHRIEYILRNTIYTAFTVKDATLFTIYELLNNPEYQKSVIKNLEDENLKNFWKNEFGKAGNYQVVKMVSGVTAKVGRFLFSPIAKRILEQSKSTINFNEILDQGKILICNLSEGKLSEDTMQLLGTTIITKIHQAALRRARVSAAKRKPFYLFIDEFQNFATASFNRMLSGGRKFGLRVTIAEQSTSQQEDRNVVNVILANVGTVICFRTASPVDEDLMLAQFSPYVKTGEIVNLPRYHFYIKMSAVEPEEPFSGQTLPMKIKHDQEKIDKLIESSRKNYAIVYQKPKASQITPETKDKGKKKAEGDAADVGSLT